MHDYNNKKQNNQIITQFTNEKNLNNFICNYKQQNTNTSTNKNLSCNQNNNITIHNRIQQN